MTTPIASPQGFAHVRLTVTDIHRSKAFYQRLFGMPPGSDFSDQINDPTSHPHHRFFWVAHGNVNGADHWTLGKTPEKPASFADLPKQRHVDFERVEGDARNVRSG